MVQLYDRYFLKPSYSQNGLPHPKVLPKLCKICVTYVFKTLLLRFENGLFEACGGNFDAFCEQIYYVAYEADSVELFFKGLKPLVKLVLEKTGQMIKQDAVILLH